MNTLIITRIHLQLFYAQSEAFLQRRCYSFIATKRPAFPAHVGVEVGS